MTKKSTDLSAADKAIAKHSPKIKITPIKSDADYEAVGKQLVEVKDHLKALKKDSDEIIKPIRAGLDKLYEKFRTVRRNLEGMESDLSATMEKWIAKKQTKAVAAAKRKAVKAPNKEIAEDLVEAATVKTAAPKMAGLRERIVYECTIIEKALIPNDIMGTEIRLVDMRAIERLAKASKGKIEIPGVVIKIVKKVGGAAR